jgi:hypothetical protein
VDFVRRHFLTHFTEQELEQMGALWQRVDAAATAVDES